MACKPCFVKYERTYQILRTMYCGVGRLVYGSSNKIRLVQVKEGVTVGTPIAWKKEIIVRETSFY